MKHTTGLKQGVRLPCHDTDHIRTQGWKIEKLVIAAKKQDLEPLCIQQICEIMKECRCDAHRIHVLDWAATAMGTMRGLQLTTNAGPSLFIDDSRYTVSSAPAAVLTTKKHTQYVNETGVICETKQNSTSTIAVNPTGKNKRKTLKIHSEEHS